MKLEEGYYVVRLFKDGCYYADRSLTCGKKTFDDAVSQWRRKGFDVKVLQQPKSHA